MPPPSRRLMVAAGRNHKNNNNNWLRLPQSIMGLVLVMILLGYSYSIVLLVSSVATTKTPESSVNNNNNNKRTIRMEQEEEHSYRLSETAQTHKTSPLFLETVEEPPFDTTEPARTNTAMTTTTTTNPHLPLGLQNVLERALIMQRHCQQLPQVRAPNDPIIATDLPDFGIIPALMHYRPSPTQQEAPHDWQCQLPPSTECDQDQFTVVFMGYRPDRLAKMRTQLFAMTSPSSSSEWSTLVAQVILVWNGERHLDETDDGRRIESLSKDKDRAFRIVYPLQEGFPNDLMNRYHPQWTRQPQHYSNGSSSSIATKAILWYDDDGPFYSPAAILAGFELWKRHANAQIGAMTRRIDVSERQEAEYRDSTRSSTSGIPQHEDERSFVSQCRSAGDEGRYNFQHFAQFGARMALPSGSFLHRNFLCFLWHPALDEVRRFVRAHPVHPDDVTVSTIVSHVSGRAPKVYPRRMNPKREGETDMEIKRRKQQEEGRQRRLREAEALFPTTNSRRKLLWADGDAAEWAQKRSSAVNSLISYFGSVNPGSLGWCYGTPYHDTQDDTCVPELARFGMVPWLTEDHTAKDACP